MPARPGKALREPPVFRGATGSGTALSDPYLRRASTPTGARPRKPERHRKTLSPGPGQAVARPLRILFACVADAARSPMALGFARSMGGSRVEARSGGVRPAARVEPFIVAVMRDKQVDIGGHVPQPFDDQWIIDQCDVIVTLGCPPDASPSFVGKPLEEWTLPDPRGQSADAVRRMRDDIERRVRAFLAERGIL